MFPRVVGITALAFFAPTAFMMVMQRAPSAYFFDAERKPQNEGTVCGILYRHVSCDVAMVGPCRVRSWDYPFITVFLWKKRKFRFGKPQQVVLGLSSSLALFPNSSP